MDNLISDNEYNVKLYDITPKTEASVEVVNANSLTGISELDTPIIGEFSGEYARLDSVSTNKRAYSAKFWKEVLATPMVKRRLADGLMIGTFEHTNSRTFFTQDGHLSTKHHMYGAFVVKELKVKGNIVWGRAYILNTAMGRLLAMYLRAKDPSGKNLFNVGISVRGFTKKDYINPTTGNDDMRSDDYYLETFDATLTPGISSARPKLESVEECFVDDSIKEIKDYEKKVEHYFCGLECEIAQLKKELGINY